MCIDYQALLKNPKVCRALGKDGVAEAGEDEDFLRNLIGEKGRTVLSLGWTGSTGGANWITEWGGLYFFSSSDYDEEGPFNSLKAAISDERFWMQTPEAELDSDVVPLPKLLEMGKALAGEEGNEVAINGKMYVLLKDNLVELEG